MLASLGAGVAQNTNGTVAASRAGTIHLVGTSTPVTIYTTETGATTYSTNGTFTTDTLGRIPGWVELGLEVDITVPPAATVTCITQGATGPPGVGAAWKGLWSSGTTYAVGDGVTGSDGHNYISVVGSNLNHNPVGDAGVHWSDLLPSSVVSVASAAPNPGAAGQEVVVRSDNTVKFTDQLATINVKAWGAVGDDATDNATVFAAIAAAIPASGARVIFPAGSYRSSGALNVDTLPSVVLEGASGTSAGVAPAAQIVYTGASGSAISARSTNGFKLRSLGVRYSSASYNGTLIDLSATGTKGSGTSRGADTAYAQVAASFIGALATGNRSANAEMVNLDHCISSEILDCTFADSNYAITGTIAGGASTYANAIHVEHCTFLRQIAAHIHNPGSGWAVDGQCTFEPLVSGAPGAVLQDSTAGETTLVFANNWLGDATAAGFQLDFQGQAKMVLVEGNFLDCGASATAACVRTGGVVRYLGIKHNTLAGQGFGYDWSAGTVVEVDICFNSMFDLVTGWSPAAYTNASPNSGKAGLWAFNYYNGAAGILDSWRTPSGDFRFFGNTKFGSSGSSLGFFGANEVTQPSNPGFATFSAGAGTTMDSAGTSTGNVGSKGYTFGDIVQALKNLGLIQS